MFQHLFQPETFIGAVFTTLVGALLTTGLLWLGARAAKRQRRRMIAGQVSIVFDPSSAQFRRYETVARSNGTKQTRTVYVLGVLNHTGVTLRGVQCFVLGVDEYVGTQERRPLQPVGQPKHAERIDVPPSTNNQPSAYFELVEDYTDGQPADEGWAFLCVPFGEPMLPFVGHVNISLEGDGFCHDARFQIAKRKPGYWDEQNEWNEVEMIPLTVKRLH